MTVSTRVLKISEIAVDRQYAVVGGPFGSKLGRKDYTTEGVPVLRGSNLPFEKRIDLTDLVFVSAEKVEKDLLGNLAHPGDIVVTQRDTLGQVGFIPTNSVFERFVVSQSQMKLTVDPAKADPRFLYYYLRSPGTVKRLIDRASSSGVPHINLEVFRNFDVELPDLNRQRSVADVLTVLDDLIENNRRRIEILEEMARLLYREWFVHFRFPGHEDVKLVDSDLGPIPEGWNTVSFSDLAEFVNGFAFKPDHWLDEGLPIVKIKELKNGVTADTPRYHGSDIQKKYFVDDGAVLFSWSADLKAYVWASGPALLNQHLFDVRPYEVTPLFVFHSLSGRMDEFRARAQGTTMKHIKRSALGEVKLALPPIELRDEFECVARPMLDLQLNLSKQIRALREARDLLLPRLVSGELDVSEL
ncbi:MAG: restriction endonuclease subunit S, partial [Acidimicrobiaceae bacterium]|nr:restriction endonuclease subunit S [Acidimicrobiaceae bacterium]